MDDQVEGVVLAGGLSSRMGRDKARLEMDGETMYVRAARRLLEAGCRRVTVIHRFPLDSHPMIAGFWIDDHGGQGPIDGLLTAMRRSTAPIVTILGVDLPLVTAESLRRSRVLLTERHEVDAVVLKDSSGRQALASSWRRDRALPIVQNCFATGERSIHRMLENLSVAELEVDVSELTNINTPEQLAELGNE